MVVERDQVLEAPEHLDNVQAAAWPLGGLTAWRCVINNLRIKKMNSNAL